MGSEEDRALYHALSTCMHSAAIYLAIYSSSHAVLRDAVSHTSNACAHLEWESRWCVLSSHQYSSDRWEGGHGTSGEPEEPPDEVSHSLTCVAVIGRSVYELTRTSDRWKSEWVAPPVRDWKVTGRRRTSLAGPNRRPRASATPSRAPRGRSPIPSIAGGLRR